MNFIDTIRNKIISAGIISLIEVWQPNIQCEKIKEYPKITAFVGGDINATKINEIDFHSTKYIIKTERINKSYLVKEFNKIYPQSDKLFPEFGAIKDDYGKVFNGISNLSFNIGGYEDAIVEDNIDDFTIKLNQFKNVNFLNLNNQKIPEINYEFSIETKIEYPSLKFEYNIKNDKFYVNPFFESNVINFVQNRTDDVIIGSANLNLIISIKRTIYDEGISIFQKMLNEDLSELEWQKFFEKYDFFLKNINFYQEIKSQLIMEYERGSYKPDFFLKPYSDDFWDIIELKLPKEPVFTNLSNYPKFSEKVNKMKEQLRTYSRFFDDSINRKRFKDKHGFTCYKPKLIGIIGNEKEIDPLVIRGLEEELPRSFQLLTYSELLEKTINLHKKGYLK